MYILYSRFCLFQVVCLVDVYFYIVDSVFISSAMFSRCILLYSRFYLLFQVMDLVDECLYKVDSVCCFKYLVDVCFYIVDSVFVVSSGVFSRCIFLYSRFCLLFQVVCLVDVYFYIVDSVYFKWYV